MSISTSIIFTRYLYVKDEIRIALLVSILQKNEDAFFWGYELFHSGFKIEVLQLLKKIYFDFFATTTPKYESYMNSKINDWHKNNGENDSTQNVIIYDIINNLLTYSFNTDVFYMRVCSENFVNDVEYKDQKIITNIEECEYNFINWIDNNDLRSISEWIINVNETIQLKDIYFICINLFIKKGSKLTKTKLLKEFITDDNLLLNKINLLSKIVSLFTIVSKKKKKQMIIEIDQCDIIQYETINNIPGNKILKTACICGIDDFI